MGEKYTVTSIKGDDDDNHLTPGTVIGIKTNEGNYAKMKVLENIPFRRKDYSSNFYFIKVQVCVYRPKKSQEPENRGEKATRPSR